MSTATLHPPIADYGVDPRVARISRVAQIGSTRSTPRPTGRLRMTRRGRAVLVTAIALPLAAGTWLAIGSEDGAIATATAASTTFSYVQVENGQSLWQIASSIAPSEDPRDVVSEIVRLNGLASSDVFPGQRLAIPQQYRG